MDSKKAHQALKLSEEQFRRAIEEAPIPTIMQAEDGQVLQLSRSWTELTDYSLSDIPTFDNWVTNVVYDSADTVRNHMHELFKGKKTTMNVEFAVRTHKKGNRVWSFSASSPGALVDGRRFIIGMAVDITDSKKAEEALKKSEQAAIKYANELKAVQEKLELKNAETEQYATKMEGLAEEQADKLRESERLAAIGATAGMVGHDIRNPLQAITGDIYILNDVLADLSDKQQKNEMKESLDSITANVSYINKIVADLQDYARPLKPEYTIFDLNKLIKESLVTIVLPDNIKLSVDTETMRAIKSDQTYLRRSITNLVNNAIQAMPDGGTLEVKSFAKEDSIFVIVSDTGVGIPEHVKSKLFTPMMTTKAKGQGLGLAVVKRLIEALNGTINFESQEGKGTKFIIELPINCEDNVRKL